MARLNFDYFPTHGASIYMAVSECHKLETYFQSYIYIPVALTFVLKPSSRIGITAAKLY